MPGAARGIPSALGDPTRRASRTRFAYGEFTRLGPRTVYAYEYVCKGMEYPESRQLQEFQGRVCKRPVPWSLGAVSD